MALLRSSENGKKVGVGAGFSALTGPSYSCGGPPDLRVSGGGVTGRGAMGRGVTGGAVAGGEMAGGGVTGRGVTGGGGV